MDEQDDAMCESCGKRKATVRLTEFVDGKPVLKLLCEKCYREQEEDLPELSPLKVFAQLLEAVAPELKELSRKVCPRCGTNYLEFRQSMRLGCPYDYEAFDEAMEQLLARMHGSSVHMGKAPGKFSLRDSDAQEGAAGRLNILQEQMEEAIAREDYEQAAMLRDKIRAIKDDEPEQAEGQSG